MASLVACSTFALDPHKSLTQYSRTTWTQLEGLPQDTVRAIAQTADGYLWVGGDEGLARFDGYEFVNFHKAGGDLPSNSITALAAAPDGSLWIGTSQGLVHYRDKRFHTYTVKDGLPDDAITQLYVDRAGAVWIVADIRLCRFEGGKFTTFAPGSELPVSVVRNLREDRDGQMWVAGLSAVGTWKGGVFTRVIGPEALDGIFITPIVQDRRGYMWFGGNKSLIVRSPDGRIRKYDERDGLPDPFVRALWEDRDGNLWAGTNAGLARLDGDRFVTPHDNGPETDMVRCLFEDREGNLWIGSNSGLTRYRDTVFTVYGKPEGLPSDEPNTVFQDSSGRIWVGFHDAGLLLFAPGGGRLYTTRDGLPNNEIFAIRQAADGDLLIAARGGFVRMHDGRFTTYVPPDPLARLTIFDALEDHDGTIWLATPGGLGRLSGKEFRLIVPGAPTLMNSMVALGRTRDGAIWGGTYGKGLWRVQGDEIRQFTTEQGLSSDQIRTLYDGPEGTLWIGTYGGLTALRNGKFSRFTESDGLLSDNVADISDDRESLWLSTTRGVCRVPKQQLYDFADGKRKRLEPTNYGLEDGLRSAQCSPAYPIGGGGNRSVDGRLWFTTTRGLAVFDPRTKQPAAVAPEVQLVEITADGQPLDLQRSARVGPRLERVQIRYTAIHLAAPERVQYSYRLEGLDEAWVRAGGRRVINYNTLTHGAYTFTVRAELPGGLASQRSYQFTVLPSFYETASFRALMIGALLLCGWGLYRLRVRRIRYRFAAVLEERARIAREIHDTLAQGFVGIGSQLDAVAMCMPDETTPARKYLDLARRMARHSLTEARRSVMDLRASALEGQDLAAALAAGARIWTAGSGVDVELEVAESPLALPQDVEQHLLRIAQEAVANALKHAGASRIWVRLHTEARKLYLRVRDNGRGFEQEGAFVSVGGHFGLIGMRERAERLGGELRLASSPGAGTEVEVSVPLP